MQCVSNQWMLFQHVMFFCWVCCISCSNGSCNLLVLRPQSTFKAAWITCGYFGDDHFPDMDHKAAVKIIDATGLYRHCGIANDLGGVMPSHQRTEFLKQFLCRDHLGRKDMT